MDPKCPDCGVIGITHIASIESEETSNDGPPWFYVVRCMKCGHVYGVFAKAVRVEGPIETVSDYVPPPRL